MKKLNNSLAYNCFFKSTKYVKEKIRLNSFIYEYLASEIYEEYRKIFSFKENVIELWKKDKSVLIYSMLMIITYVVFVISLLQDYVKSYWKFTFCAFVFILLVYLTYKFFKSVNSVIYVAYAKHIKMIKKVETILNKHGINLNDKNQLKSLLNENKDVTNFFESYFNNVIDKIFKLLRLFVIVPVGFLLALGFNAEKDSISENITIFTNSIFTLIPNVIIFGFILVITFTIIYILFLSNDFISFVFPSQNKAYIFNKYVRVFLYDSVFVNYKKI